MNANIRALDLNLLLAFDALYEERSVTRAADRLALSQPAVSGILNRLRNLFEDALFLRTSHGIVPTPRADALAGQIRHVIRSTQTLFEEEAFDPSTDSFEISLCGTDYVNRVLFSTLVPDILRTAPNAQISISHISSLERQEREILERADLMFFSYDPMLPEPEGQFLFGDEMVCVSSYRAHAEGEYVPLDALCALSHVLGQWTMRSSVSERLTNVLREQGLARNIVLRLPDFASVFRLMQTCELVAFLPAKLVAHSGGGLKRLRVDLDIPAAAVFARWHPRLEKEPRHVWLRQKVTETAKSLDDRH